MDFSYGGNSSGSGDEQKASNNRKGKKHYHRHTTYQIQQLEGLFKECPHLDDNQQLQLSRDLGLEPKQIQFWFQNKRAQAKAQSERADNSSLRFENEKIRCENFAICEAIKNVICPACGGPPFGEEERKLHFQKLKMENSLVKQEYERLSQIVADSLGKSVWQIQSLSRSMDLQALQAEVQWMLGGSSFDLDFGNSSNSFVQCPLNGIEETRKSLMFEKAVDAMGELTRLLRVNEPMWVKSPVDGRYILHRDSYNKLFPKLNHFRSSTARIESSKDSGLVAMSAMHLIEMFMDSNKWVDLFPTTVTKARTIEVIDTRMLGEQASALQLMYEQMHIFSPLVSPREFYFLRYCKEVEPGMWMMVDMSYDWPREDSHDSPLQSWRLPSGCMVRDKSNGWSEVTWVEHVEVDDKSKTHRLYRDLVWGSLAYGAQRWITTLQRMSERLAYSSAVIDRPEGTRSILDLSHRMVKNFWAMLNMSGKMDFPHWSELNNSGVRVSVCLSDGPGQPSGMVFSAASSLWLPLSCEALFNFFRDENSRSQWDVLSVGNPVHEIANISCGTHPGNCISIIQSFAPKDSNMLVLQESCIDPLGSLIVYAPIDFPAIKSAISGKDSTNIPILPSGFIISGDGRCPDKGTGGASTSTGRKTRYGGSLLTVAFQILECTHSKQINMDSVTTVNTLVSSSIQKIKAALDCSSVDP
ncbi:hypothetical protein Vadar_001195 [Vaccinium darrowii]|uniref:Uncharacterized protein n=1 Tax=Vaccinium darrowii TaxID=229202 RepID=A0ACB7Y5N3_9ERIC|nr:hypothetical protein Vadar_001195 [Vaccinium darrowii]